MGDPQPLEVSLHNTPPSAQLGRAPLLSASSPPSTTSSRACSVVLPSALPGIVTGVVLGVGRSISETAAVIFTAGSSLPLEVPTSLFDGTRTLSVHFYQLAREGISEPKAYATAAVLVLAILAINAAAYATMHRFMRRYR